MSVITWNIRGLNKTYKQKDVKEFIRSNNKAIIALVEHRVKEHRANDIIKKIAHGWQWISNASPNKKSRIWVLWDPRIYKFDMEEADEQLVHGQISILSKAITFGFSAIYGLHTIKDRLSLWRKLRQIHSIQQGPWLAMRDYNAILQSQDRRHGNEVQDIETRDFKEFLLDTGMHELQYVGRDYTWTNNHTYSRIDRGLVNADWMMMMPNMKVQVLEPLVSDHSPLKLMISQVQGRKSRPFRFLNCIADHHQFLQKVEQAWEEGSTGGMIQIVWNKLKRVNEVIKEINTKHYKGVDERIKRMREELQSTQEEMSFKLQRQDLIEKEKALKGDLEKWILIEESIYMQRSRVQWLKLGDSNSAYFFAQMKNRSNLNGIQFLTNDMGVQLVLEDDIEAEILGYYKKLLGSSAESLPAINPNDMKMGPVLSKEHQLLLIKQVSKEEIWEAMKDINDLKAPGYDGLNAVFFKKSWTIIGQEVIMAVQEFFESNQMFRPINCTAIP
ncbi:PREDICTED: uncharacterized protein LOC109219434 [Nicotiana attenuata]|uniref:uncharacterized protein LOC109219434 n=1 Tax=Nicotiana attenuata TaxID=49451 RepID=UPI0009058E87|nr:PREDICTED: uncharacterized protein LOC109219434 [Nicotiana attenuata]